MADIYRMAVSFKERLLEREGGASARLLHRYAQSYQVIQAEIDRYQAKLDDYVAKNGVTRAEAARLNPSWPFQEGRLESIRASIIQEMGRLASDADHFMTGERRAAVEMANAHAQALSRQGVMDQVDGDEAKTRVGKAIDAVWNRPNLAATEMMVGLVDGNVSMGTGSPLQTKVFSSYGALVAQEISSTLVSHFMAGFSPRQTAGALKKLMAGNAVRAQRVARTETMRAYRLATREAYVANPEIVEAWRWLSALQMNTCIACLAQHGVVYKVEDLPADHVSGRCTSIPVTRSYRDIGKELGREARSLPSEDPRHRDLMNASFALEDPSLVDSRVSVMENGPTWLSRQSKEAQIAILGPTRYAAYSENALSLQRMSEVKIDPTWGPSHLVKPLKSLFSPADLAKWQAKGDEIMGRAPRKSAQPSTRNFPDLDKQKTWGEVTAYLKARRDAGYRPGSEVEARAIGKRIREEYEQRVGPRAAEADAAAAEQKAKWLEAKAEAKAANEAWTDVGERWRRTPPAATKEEYEAARVRVRNAYDKVDAESALLQGANRKAAGVWRDGYLEIMGEVRELGGVQLEFATKGRTGIAKRAVQEASTFYPKEWLEASNSHTRTVRRAGGETVDVPYPLNPMAEKGRGYYTETSRTKDFAACSDIVTGSVRGAKNPTASQIETMVHELGHRFEDILGLADLETEFYERRTAGLDARKLSDIYPGSNYKAHEVSREDDFLSAYVGKDYRPTTDSTSSSTYWEVFTMGSQSIWEGFKKYPTLQKDPDLLDFILGTLGGV